MSTITGEILIGRGHPNDDGMMAFSILGRLQLIEGDRASWAIETAQEDWLRDYRFTIAPRPGQITMCGLDSVMDDHRGDGRGTRADADPVL
ncbi:hypothetical protein NUH88_09125 [Nisaea acidiphila]|uniref:Uncharacterized protein n=1 Tax=Nisaea acidiphila TaxID=1862145 RepID=A0A9J7AZK3_9PROT|nr:hypothetical protein [Nisaea acidiphila]UUX51849.1 hypothetical protein NUH88_09125 [Nisaea acidiphila]